MPSTLTAAAHDDASRLLPLLLQTFDERMDTEALYRYTVKPLVAYAFERRGRGTCIAYGQTGEHALT